MSCFATRHSKRQTALGVLLAVLSLAAAAQSAGPATSAKEAVQRAVVSNPEVQARWHAFRAAREEQNVARGGYLPRLDLSAGVGRERQTDPGLANRDYTRRNASLALSQMLYDGFATRSEVSRLGHAKLARYFELLDATETTALEALRAYEDVLRYRDLVQLAQQNYVQHRQVYEQIQQRVEAGVGRRVDLEQASGRLALAESNLLTEASNLHDVSARYQRVVGELPGEALAPTGLTGLQLPESVEEGLRAAYQASPAFNAAAEGVRSARAEADGRRSRFQPRVDLRARSDLGNNLDGINGHSDTQVVEVVLTYNLFNGGSDQAAVRQFVERLDQARDLRDRSCRDLRQTLAIAYNDRLRLMEQLRYLDQHQLSIAKAREAYRKQFDIGQRTLLDLLDTENEYFQAQRAYANANHDYALAHARTLAGMGKLLAALEVRRGDLPSLSELVEERDTVDPATACPAEAPAMPQIDKAALLAAALPVPSVAVPAPATPPAPATDAALIERVEAWAAAWSAKDLDRYLGFYADGFVPTHGQTTGGASRAAWEAARRQYLAKPDAIEVKVSDMQVEAAGADAMATTFRQTYHSGSFTDTVQKRLEWKREGGTWKIRREVVVAD